MTTSASSKLWRLQKKFTVRTSHMASKNVFTSMIRLLQLMDLAVCLPEKWTSSLHDVGDVVALLRKYIYILPQLLRPFVSNLS